MFYLDGVVLLFQQAFEVYQVGYIVGGDYFYVCLGMIGNVVFIYFSGDVGFIDGKGVFEVIVFVCLFQFGDFYVFYYVQ